MRWEEKQYQRQLKHYSPKRTFNHIVDLELEPEQIAFPGIGGTIFISPDWFTPRPWRPDYEMLKWLHDHVGHEYYVCRERGVVAFTKPEDAIAFKLTWR